MVGESPPGAMRCRIHRGAHEIGGNCIEVEAQGARIVLDLGMPLAVPRGATVPLPPIAGLVDEDPSLLGIVLSHPHPDHYGLIATLPYPRPVFMGEAASRLLQEAAFFTPGGLNLTPAGFLRHRMPFTLGPFTITPFLNDHSAFDAYSLLIEAGGSRLFYTGDLRAHGRKAHLFEQLLREPPRDIDTLLMEGTHVRPDGEATPRGPSEHDVEEACVQTMRLARGQVLAMYSAQNIDRLVTLYRAARRAGRELVMDLYTASMAAATGNRRIPQADWHGVRVYLPGAQRRKVIAARAFARTDRVRARRIFPEELRARRDALVITFRSSMLAELEQEDLLRSATGVWSMWPGYLRDDSSQRLLVAFARHGIDVIVHHASGHAYVDDLQRLAHSLDARQVVPIHSTGASHFASLFRRSVERPDDTWWPVAGVHVRTREGLPSQSAA